MSLKIPSLKKRLKSFTIPKSGRLVKNIKEASYDINLVFKSDPKKKITVDINVIKYGTSLASHTYFLYNTMTKEDKINAVNKDIDEVYKRAIKREHVVFTSITDVKRYSHVRI